MLHRSGRYRPQDFTMMQFFLAVLLNLCLLLACFWSYQTAYRLEENPYFHLSLPTVR